MNPMRHSLHLDHRQHCRPVCWCAIVEEHHRGAGGNFLKHVVLFPIVYQGHCWLTRWKDEYYTGHYSHRDAGLLVHSAHLSSDPLHNPRSHEILRVGVQILNHRDTSDLEGAAVDVVVVVDMDDDNEEHKTSPAINVKYAGSVGDLAAAKVECAAVATNADD